MKRAHKEGDRLVRAIYQNIFLFLLMICTPSAFAEVLIINKKSSAILDGVAKNIEREISQKVSVGSAQDLYRIRTDGILAVITVGLSNLEEWIEISSTNGPPIISIFAAARDISQLDYVRSAIYIDPPIERQVRLAQLIFGTGSAIGIIVPDFYYLKLLGVNKSVLSKMGVTVYSLSQQESITHALAAALAKNRALIGIYDPQVYGADNLKNILITAYRRSRALIGPSKAYLKAGAMATTYSDTDDLERRLVQVLKEGIDSGEWPEKGYNPYFKIGYNEQVARSLNIILPDEEVALKYLRGEE